MYTKLHLCSEIRPGYPLCELHNDQKVITAMLSMVAQSVAKKYVNPSSDRVSFSCLCKQQPSHVISDTGRP